jgi:FtsH-binding integral membrane protein
MMTYSFVLLVLHLAVTLFLTGLIWVIQWVHYPLMSFVGESRFIEFEKEHCRRIGTIVAPAMIVEGILAMCVIAIAKSAVEFLLGGIGVLLCGLIWWSTFRIQVPIHDRLALGRSEELIRQLVRSNWIRTWSWTGRSLVAMVLFQ